jgi:curved DNA-binding protein
VQQLFLPATATLDQVEARYRDLARKHHPNRGGDQAEFVRVQEAFEQAREILGR